MEPPAPRVALYYEDDAYVEKLRGGPTRPDGPAGLMGRQVAGKTFLDAYLRHASADTDPRPSSATGPQPSRSRRRSATGRRTGPARANCTWSTSRNSWSPPRRSTSSTPRPRRTPATPGPGTSAGRHNFALSGVTHTLSTARTASMIRDLILAPFEPYDALICTSSAVVAMVREVAGAYSDYLADRHGGRPVARPPPGADPPGRRHRRLPAGDPRGARRAARRVRDRRRRRSPCCSSAGSRITPRPTRTRCTAGSPRPPARPAGAST